jgi:hypothetical protein
MISTRNLLLRIQFERAVNDAAGSQVGLSFGLERTHTERLYEEEALSGRFLPLSCSVVVLGLVLSVGHLSAFDENPFLMCS